MPVDAEEVTWMNIPKSNILQFVHNVGRNFGRVFHLCIRRDDNVAFFCALNGAGTAVVMCGEIDGSHGILLKICQTISDYISQYELALARFSSNGSTISKTRRSSSQEG